MTNETIEKIKNELVCENTNCDSKNELFGCIDCIAKAIYTEIVEPMEKDLANWKKACEGYAYHDKVLEQALEMACIQLSQELYNFGVNKNPHTEQSRKQSFIQRAERELENE